MPIKIPLSSKFYLFLFILLSLITQLTYGQDTLTFRNDTKQKLYEDALPKFKAKLDSTVKIAMTYKGYTLKYIANIKELVGNINCSETFNKICLDKICKDADSLELNDSAFTISLKELVNDDDVIKNFAQFYLVSEFVNSLFIEVAAAANTCYWEKLYDFDIIDRFSKYGADKWDKEEAKIISDIEEKSKAVGEKRENLQYPVNQ